MIPNLTQDEVGDAHTTVQRYVRPLPGGLVWINGVAVSGVSLETVVDAIAWIVATHTLECIGSDAVGIHAPPNDCPTPCLEVGYDEEVGWAVWDYTDGELELWDWDAETHYTFLEARQRAIEEATRRGTDVLVMARTRRQWRIAVASRKE